MVLVIATISPLVFLFFWVVFLFEMVSVIF